MAKKILCSSHVLWITDRPESGSGMAKAMQIDRKSERVLAALANPRVDCSTIHRSSFVRRPQTTMPSGTWDRITKFGQVRVDACGERLGGQKNQRLSRLHVLRGDFKHPEIAGFQEVFADTQRRQRPSSQGCERKKRDDEAVAVPKCIAFMVRA